MFKVFKYKLKLETNQVLMLPENSKILSVINQNDNVVLYAEVNVFETKTKPIDIYILGTGEEIPKGADKFMGTVSLLGGSVIVHVFCNSNQFYFDEYCSTNLID